MKFFLDTADLATITEYLKMGFIEGITTNPVILKKSGFTNPQDAWKQIIALINKHTKDPISLSAEVFTDNADAMFTQALEFCHELRYPGLAIKIPILGLDGEPRLRVIERLAAQGIKVNCTACITTAQARAAAMAGATFVSLLYRRIMDQGLDGEWMISTTREFLDQRKLKAEIIVGSIREPGDVYRAGRAGAHIVTVPPQHMLFHQKSVDTQREFLEAAGGVLPVS